jgi:hypothetical protein
MSNHLILITDIPKQLKVMRHSMEFTNSINLIRVKVKWCHNHRSKDKVNRQKRVAKGNILIRLRLQKDLWVIKVVMHKLKKSKDPHKPICFKFIKEDNLPKIILCNRKVKINKGHRYKTLEIVSKIWILTAISIKSLRRNLLLIRTKAYKGLLLKLRNLLLDQVSRLRLLIKYNQIRL